MPIAHLLLVAGLFSGEDYTAWSVGPYDHTTAPEAIPLDPAALADPTGMEISLRRIFEMHNRSTTPTGERYSLRIWRNPDGSVRLDDLEVRSLLVAVRSRPALGDDFELGLLVGSWDEVIAHNQSYHSQWSLYTPLAIHMFGLSKNDMDDDQRMKYFAGVAGGLGGETLNRLIGNLGLHAQGETRLKSVSRWRSGQANTTRHELETQIGLGLSWMGQDRDWVLSAWGENLLRWDPRDDAGRDGVNLQYDAVGMRLTMRLHHPKQEAEPDLDDLLARLRGTMDPMAALEDLEPNPPISLDPEASISEVTTRTTEEEDKSGEPLLVHWSEPEVVERNLPDLPTGVAEEEAECKLRFFIDASGQPYDIKPEGCTPPLLGPAMAAAWKWRMEPFIERGEARPIQFLYSVRWDSGGP